MPDKSRKVDELNNDIKFTFYSYNENEFKQNNNLNSLESYRNADTYINWLDLSNLKEPRRIEQIGEAFGLHHLIVEDILNTNQMVKLDNYDDCLFIVMKMLKFNISNSTIDTEHISIVLKGKNLISFQECDGDIFSQVKSKIEAGKDRIRNLGADYLFYELIDIVVDNYFEVIDNLGDVTDDIEEELMTSPSKNTLQRIYFVKRELMYLRKSLFPLRELIGQLTRLESGVIGDNIIIYLRDVYDHLIQIIETIETYQDIMSNMLDTYLSSIANKTNDTMKVLTVISTIFIPLTFLAGIYGMNFKDIPELNFKYGYLFFWLVAVIIFLAMLWLFRKKKWF